MTAVSRRSFLVGAAAAGVALAASPRAGADTVPLVREDHRVIVIGSGFGGGVSALRLSEAGVPVLVLERGKRWPTGPDSETFPRASDPDQRIIWHKSYPELFGRPMPFEPHTGLIEAVMGDNISALCAAGVGGGSLVYQGMSLKPAEHVFATHFPEELDYRTMSAVHYPRVAAMLGLAEAPDELIDSPTYAAARIFARNVREAGMPLSKIPMPVDWNYALAETRGEMKPSYTNGDGALGVNNGGKHSIDVTYLAAAEATGRTTVAPLHDVTSIERTADGRWRVYVDRTDTTGKVLENKILTTPTLVMAAGSLGTTRLLVRAGATGAVPDLPDGLGEGWGTNADRIYAWNNLGENFGMSQGGPVVYGSLQWEDPKSAFTIIQASLPPLGIDSHTTMMVGYGVSEGRGRLTYDPARGDTVLQWPKEGDSRIQNEHIGPAATKIAGPGSVLLDTNTVVPSTWHPLGGACMNTVCDLEGRVHGQRGLYVLDGALMPGNTAACNPSMTIAAVAERAMDEIVARDVGVTI